MFGASAKKYHCFTHSNVKRDIFDRKRVSLSFSEICFQSTFTLISYKVKHAQIHLRHIQQVSVTDMSVG